MDAAPRGDHLGDMKSTNWFVLALALAVLAGTFAIAVSLWAILLGVPPYEEAFSPALGVGPMMAAVFFAVACILAAMFLVRKGEEPSETP